MQTSSLPHTRVVLLLRLFCTAVTAVLLLVMQLCGCMPIEITPLLQHNTAVTGPSSTYCGARSTSPVMAPERALSISHSTHTAAVDTDLPAAAAVTSLTFRGESGEEGLNCLIPHLPSSSLSQLACIPFASGVTAPSPVTTTRLWTTAMGGGSAPAMTLIFLHTTTPGLNV